MSETISGVLTVEGVVESTHKGEPRQGSYGEYSSFSFVVDGLSISTTLSANKDAPVSEGDYVKVDYKSKTTNGKTYNNVINIKHINNKEATKQQEEPAKTEAPKAKAIGKAFAIKSGQPAQQTTTKDISMEVSGLLQAIINKHGLTENTESQLREALQLKRKVAGELENNGSV